MKIWSCKIPSFPGLQEIERREGLGTSLLCYIVIIFNHENTGPTRIPRAFSPQAQDISVFINFVVTSHLHNPQTQQETIAKEDWKVHSYFISNYFCLPSSLGLLYT